MLSIKEWINSKVKNAWKGVITNKWIAENICRDGQNSVRDIKEKNHPENSKMIAKQENDWKLAIKDGALVKSG
jgi:hypothetical protein